jgi:hypothetical protein
MLGELFNVTQVVPDRSGGVVAALEFFEHQLA